MPSAASWERNSSLDSWHVAEIEYPGVYVEEVSLGIAPIAGVLNPTRGQAPFLRDERFPHTGG